MCWGWRDGRADTLGDMHRLDIDWSSALWFWKDITDTAQGTAPEARDVMGFARVGPKHYVFGGYGTSRGRDDDQWICWEV